MLEPEVGNKKENKFPREIKSHKRWLFIFLEKSIY